eukprot:283792-Pelagomonas_calceolata.AAC.7
MHRGYTFKQEKDGAGREHTQAPLKLRHTYVIADILQDACRQHRAAVLQESGRMHALHAVCIT